MNRQQLIDIVNRYVDWIHAKPVDSAGLASIFSKDVVIRIPYPGSTPTFDGLVELTLKGHEASPDFRISTKTMVVDVEKSSIVTLIQATGTHKGYHVLSSL